MTPIPASKNINEKVVYNNLRDNRETQKPKFKLGQLVRVSDIRKAFSNGEGTNYSYKLNTITEVFLGTIPNYRFNYLPQRYKENLLLPTKLSPEENYRVMKELNLIQ